MTRKEKLLTAYLLDKASEEFSNHGCNDLSYAEKNLLSQGEWDKLNKEFHEYNGDPEEYKSGEILSYDWLWMKFMAYKLRKDK
jgi:hypothetical protein